MKLLFGHCRIFVAGCAALVMVSTSVPAGAADHPGRMVTVDSTRFHIQCVGDGFPTVVLESGLGTAGLEWTPLQRLLAGYARVCSYDRAGLGWSEVSQTARTASAMAGELRQLLEAAAETPPYVLAAHSFGGLIAQVFARKYPRDTAGLVLIDSSHPQQVSRFRAPPIALNTAPRPGALMMVARAPGPPVALPAEFRAATISLNHQAQSIRAASLELAHFSRSAEQAGGDRVPLDVPVVVLSRGRKMWAQGRTANLKEALWRRLQSELTALSEHSAHIVARLSGHHVHLDQPQVAADAVRLVLRNLRGQCASPRCAISLSGASWLSNSLSPGITLAGGPVRWSAP